MLRAIKEALKRPLTVRAVGRKYDIDHATLLRYSKKYSKSSQSQSSSTDKIYIPTDLAVGYSKPRQVFTDSEENLLEEYVKKAASLSTD